LGERRLQRFLPSALHESISSLFKSLFNRFSKIVDNNLATQLLETLLRSKSNIRSDSSAPLIALPIAGQTSHKKTQAQAET
jgi:hypothetical protein